MDANSNTVSDFSQLDFVDTSYDQPRNTDTVTRDIVSQRQEVGASTNDSWGGFWQKAVGNVLDYGMRKDAAVTGVQMQQAQRQPQQQTRPVYGPAASVNANGITVSPMLLLVGGLVAMLVMKK